MRIKWDDQPLGKVEDKTLAAELGVTRQAVTRARQVRGIPAYNQRDNFSLLCEIVFEHVGTRWCKTKRQLYYEVINDYGSVTFRHMNRVLSFLVATRKVAVITPVSGYSGDSHKGEGHVGFVRYDSPVLWERDGLSALADTLNGDVTVRRQGVNATEQQLELSEEDNLTHHVSETLHLHPHPWGNLAKAKVAHESPYKSYKWVAAGWGNLARAKKRWAKEQAG